MTTQTKTTWRSVKLGEVADINMGQSPRSEFYNTRGDGLPFYQGVTDFGEKYPKKSIYCLQPAKVADVGDIFFSVRAPVGDVNVATEKSCIGRGVAALRMKNRNNDFLYFLLKNYERYFKGISGGTTYESINKNQIENIELLVPENPADQKRIADILSAFDDKIEINNKISAVLEQMAQAIFKEWFVSRTQKEKKKKISDVATLNRGVSYSSREIMDSRKGMPLINLANFVRGGGFKIDGIKSYTGKFKTNNVVKAGQVVIAMTDITHNREVVGHPARIPESLDGAVVSLDVCAVETEPKYAEFLYFLMLRKSFSAVMASSATGTNVSHLNKRNVESYEFVLPQDELLEKFKNVVRPLLAQKNNLEEENQKLAALRDLLLPKLMSGEIRV